MESPLPPDPYAALGVPKTADANTIKSTYRKLALKFHPDKVTDESKKAEATEKFHSIQQAYDIIGDEDRRAKYDAIIKLAELRRQNIELRNQAGPRVEVRTAGYDVRTAAPPYASFQTRGPTRVYTEERRPSYYDDDDLPRASRKFEFNYVNAKRASPKEEKEKRERAHASDQEKKRAERRREREADVRDARDRKFKATYFDEEFARYEAERRQRDQEEEARREEARRKETEARRPPLRREEYEEERKQADARRYMASHSSKDVPRPSMFRRSSTHDSPSSGYTYTPRRTSNAEKEYFSPRELSPKGAPKRNVENVEPFDRRPATLQSQNSAPPKVPSTPKETMEPRKIPHPPHRAYTTQTDFDRRKEVVNENEPPHINLPHAHTFNDFTTSTPRAAKKTEAKTPHTAPPKPAAQPDMSYPPESPYFPPPPPQPQTTTTQYVYPKDAPTTPKVEMSNKYATPSYRVEERAPPGTSSRRAPSPQREASSTAKKMAHLGSAGPRVHASTSRSSPYAAYPETPSGRPSMMQQSSSSRSMPRASRSPERVSSSERRSSERVRERERERDRERRYERERERDRDRGRDVERERERDRYRDDRRREKLYGEIGPGYIRSTQATSGSFVEDGVSYSRRIRPEDVVYASGGSRGSRERVYNERRPSFSRSSTMPVYAN